MKMGDSDFLKKVDDKIIIITIGDSCPQTWDAQSTSQRALLAAMN